MKKNKLSFFILLSFLIFLLSYIFLAIDPFDWNLVTINPYTGSSSGNATYDDAQSKPVTGIIRKDFSSSATAYESTATTHALNHVDSPIKYTREESLARILELSEIYPEMLQIYNTNELYPSDILLSLANNPEMLDFALNYLNEKQTINGFYTEAELEEDYPLFLQWDFRWGYMKYGSTSTMGTSGCGPCALAMAIFYLTRNPEVTPDIIAQYSIENKYYVEDIGTSWSFLDHYPTLYGLEVDHIYAHAPYFKAELDKGNILICSVKSGTFTYGGHFIVIYDYDENGFKVNDPKCAYRSSLTWDFEEFRYDIRRTWVISNPE